MPIRLERNGEALRRRTLPVSALRSSRLWAVSKEMITRRLRFTYAATRLLPASFRLFRISSYILVSSLEFRMPRRVMLVEDAWWPEVIYGNTYALFMGYLSMAVKGLGFLVLTWTTVVLLGGFVSTLQKKDFWCLTLITLMQTAGIFDVLLTEKLSYIGESIKGIANAAYVVLRSNPLGLKCECLANTVAVVQMLLFGILLCPLAAVYIFGLLISAGISAWRLRQHDYGSDADGLGNLKPALDVLYSLALLQGVIFCYKTIYGFAKGSIVNEVLRYSSKVFGDQYYVGISDYILETMTGCEKDPSFARGRNLITYAVDLMGSKSPNDYISGVKILDAFAKGMERNVKLWEEAHATRNHRFILDGSIRHHILIKHLIMSASSTEILQKLLQTLGLKSMYNRTTRERAARIVANLFAMDIRLEEFPWGICHISSLIDTLEVYDLLQPYEREWLYETYEQDWFKVGLQEDWSYEDSDVARQNDYKKLMVQGFRILRKLAANVDNCKVMLHTPYLLRKIMAPVTSDLLHNIDHGAWSSIVEGSLRVMAQLMKATGQTGNKLRSEISSSNEAINSIERILECDKCDQKLQKQVILIFKQLYKDSSLLMGAASKERFIEMLVNFMIDGNKDKEARREEAAITLVAISSETQTAATVIMKVNENVVDNLTAMIFQKHICRLSAAQLLEYLCMNYTKNDESLRKLQKTMIEAVPKLLLGILSPALEERRTGAEVDQGRSTKPETDVENQGGESQDNGQGNNSSTDHQQYIKLNKYGVVRMLSLCVTVCDTLIGADQDLADQFDAVAPRDGALSFPRKLEEFVRKNMKPKVNCLEIVKLTCKMVISMMNHRGTYVKEDMESLMDALSSASKEMFLIDGSMVFSVTQDDATTMKPFRSLVSFVKEAQELVDKHYELSS